MSIHVARCLCDAPRKRPMFARDAARSTFIRDAVRQSSKARDPTGTLPLQRKFVRDLNSRWASMKRLLISGVTRFSEPSNTIAHAAVTGEDPVRAFQYWIDEALTQIVIGRSGGWLLPYVRQASNAGDTHARLAGVVEPPASAGRLNDTFDPDQPRDGHGQWTSTGSDWKKIPVEMVLIKDLRTNPNEQWEAGATNNDNDRWTKKLAKRMGAGYKFTAINVYREPDGSLTIIDGRHRYEAAKLLGRTHIGVQIKNRPVNDADWDEGKHPRDKDGRWTDTAKAEELFSDYDFSPLIKLSSGGDIIKAGEIAGDRGINEQEAADINSVAAHLQSLASSTMSQHKEVWRGFAMPVDTDVKAAFKKGQVVTFDGLTATSHLRDVAAKYTDPQYIGEEDGVSVLLRLGRNGGIIGHDSKTGELGDAETIIPSGSKYRVQRVSKEGDVYVVDLYDKGDLNSLKIKVSDWDEYKHPRDKIGQFALTQTSAFKEWFGDSKVVDKSGRPLIVYHGSPDARFLKGDDAQFKGKSRFGMSEHNDDNAFWFASSRALAASYADDTRAFDYQNAEPATEAFYVSLQNPLVINAGGKEWREAQAHGKTSDVIDQARKEGHDGVIISNVRDYYNNTARTPASDTFVAFRPEQIKSVKNRGTFDPKKKTILDAFDPDDRTPLIQSLAIAELRGIADAVSQQLVRAFAYGLMMKTTPSAITANMRNIVDKVGVRRGRLLVSFITVRMFSAATLDGLRARGVTHVGIVPEGKPLVVVKDANEDLRGMVEVLTAGDNDVCQACQDISEGGPYTLDEAESLIPAHPECRCAFVPAYDERFAEVEHEDVEDAPWREDLHPRDKDGKWTTAADGSAVLYHGTAMEHLPSIREKGLMSEGVQRNWVNAYYKGDRAKSVFLSHDLEGAQEWAKSAFGPDIRRGPDDQGKNVIVLEIHIPKGYVKKLGPDNFVLGDKPTGGSRYKGSIPPKWIKQILTSKAGKDDWVKDSDWDESKHPRDKIGQFAPAVMREQSGSLIVPTGKEFDQQIKNLTPTIDDIARTQGWNETTVRMVTGDGYKPHFESVTGSLREKGYEASPADIKEVTDKLDAMFQSAALPEALTAWRGWRADPYYAPGKDGKLTTIIPKTDYKPGDEFTDPAFFMTTLAPDYAMHATAARVTDPIDRGFFPVGTKTFAGETKWHPNRVVFQIDLPVGAPALVPPTKAAAPSALARGLRVTNREAIVLLPRDTTFRVLSVTPPSDATLGANVVRIEPVRYGSIKKKVATDADWDESKHPRDKEGQFTESGEMLTVYRGESVHNRGGNFYSPDAEWARQFTQSGRQEEVLKRQIPANAVYDPPKPVYAGNPEAVDVAIAEARAAGKHAVRLSEGDGEPQSIYVFNPKVLKNADDIQGEAATEIVATVNEEQVRNIKTAADKVAADLGYDASKISVRTDDRKFTLNGQRYDYAGAAHITGNRIGDIELYAKHLTPSTVAEVTAHEIGHQKFQAFMDDYERESQKMTKATTNIAFNSYMKPNGLLREPYDKQFPLYQKYTEVMTPSVTETFSKSDGITPYSEEWWKSWKDGVATTPQAFHETIAEMTAREYLKGPDYETELEKFKAAGYSLDVRYGTYKQPSVYKVRIWKGGPDPVDEQTLPSGLINSLAKLRKYAESESNYLGFPPSSRYKKPAPEWVALFNAVNEHWDNRHK